MDLFLDITLGIGLATAAGLRPFLPALLAGALASSDLGVDFDHGSFAFLEHRWFLAIVVIVLVAAWAHALRARPESVEEGPVAAAAGGLALGLGAVLFAGSLAQHSDLGWIGLPAGLACAALAQVVSRGVLSRARRRLTDVQAQRALGLYAEAVALALAAVSILAPPVSLLALAVLVRLLLAGRRQDGARYAGLRILR
ncbi:MAG TPA: hypothetical protein VGN69_02945 [Solirubrobacteraceae bacterium]|jgi:high-affinity Fe2+/Pb2+ permease|nr:hypothetical protein [Solirubrobacteraceae bacterium]